MKKNQHFLLSILLCFITSLQVQAQYDLPQSRVWAMGNKIGLDFTNLNNPMPIVTSLTNANEAAASICDTSGNMLFYTNGMIVWDKNGTPMPHGGALIGNTNSTLSTTQGAVIVPMPDSANKYYLFSLTAVSNCLLYCNVIDMNKNNGLGDVDTTFYLYHTTIGNGFLTEKMTAVSGCNNSVWLFVHVQSTQEFRAYHITPAGLDTTAVSSIIGSFSGANYQQGVIKFSPDRTKMLTCNYHTKGGIELFDFDYSTGLLSNPVILDSASFYGGTFSPNSTKVYAEATTVINQGAVYQWDLNNVNPATSKLSLGLSGQYTDMKLGPDGKIYFGALPGGAGYSNYRFMGRINNPDNAGTACNFQDSVTSLVFPVAGNPTHGSLSQGLPNDIAVPTITPGSDQHVVALDTTICASFQGLALPAPAGYSTRSWDNGDTTVNRIISARGTYWVQSLSACSTRTDTFIIKGANMPTLAITYNTPTLSSTTGFANYQWYKDGQIITGATNVTYTANQNGIYSVYADYGSSCHDSTAYHVTDFENVASNNLNNKITIYPNPSQDNVYVNYTKPVNISVYSMDGKLLINTNHTNTITISTLADGLYVIVITDENQQKLGMQKLIKTSK